MTEISKELLHDIEGQTHTVCATHNLPMLTVTNRKAKCVFGDKKYFRCPDLNYINFTCEKCTNELNKNKSIK